MEGGTTSSPAAGPAAVADGSDSEDGTAESRAALRARLADAERLVRRLRAEAERRRREVLAAAARAAGPVAGGAGGAVTNLLFDGAAARHAHVRHAPHAAASGDHGRPCNVVARHIFYFILNMYMNDC